MKKTLVALLATLALITGSSIAGATTIDLAEYLTIGGVKDISSFSTATGLGTLKLKVSGSGAHYAGLFVDHEIDQLDNLWYNETGSTSGAAAAGLSWEIDEPTGVEGLAGDIKIRFLGNNLENNIFGGNSSAIDDVSMAMGWNFILAADETATITFNIFESAPTSGFYLQQYDPDSNASVYFSSTMGVSQDGTPAVPEPSTILLLGAGLAGLGIYGRRRNKK